MTTELERAIYSMSKSKSKTTELTRQYWMHVFDEWAEARLAGPQYDEAHQVLKECGMKPRPQDDDEDETQ